MDSVQGYNMTSDKQKPDAEFAALVNSLCGSMSYLHFTADDFLTVKHAAAKAENEAWNSLK